MFSKPHAPFIAGVDVMSVEYDDVDVYAVLVEYCDDEGKYEELNNEDEE